MLDFINLKYVMVLKFLPDMYYDTLEFLVWTPHLLWLRGQSLEL